ncbi:hypothetical protein [Catelliglobosispora koreensis]|nr:hypothetical protein [Catelliglobosispora koreensis]
MKLFKSSHRSQSAAQLHQESGDRRRALRSRDALLNDPMSAVLLRSLR